MCLLRSASAHSLRFGRRLFAGTGTWTVADDKELDSGLVVSACDTDGGDGVGDCLERPSRQGIAVNHRSLDASRSPGARGSALRRRRIPRADGAVSERAANGVDLLGAGNDGRAGPRDPLHRSASCGGRRLGSGNVGPPAILGCLSGRRRRVCDWALPGYCAAVCWQRDADRTAGDPGCGNRFRLLVRCPAAPGATFPSACGGMRTHPGDGAASARRFPAANHTGGLRLVGPRGAPPCLARALAGVGSPGSDRGVLLCITVPMLPACCAKVSHCPSLKPRR